MKEKSEDKCVIICKAGDRHYPKYVKLENYENEVKNHNKIDGIEILGSFNFPGEKYGEVSKHTIGIVEKLDMGESVDIEKELEKAIR